MFAVGACVPRVVEQRRAHMARRGGRTDPPRTLMCGIVTRRHHVNGRLETGRFHVRHGVADYTGMTSHLRRGHEQVTWEIGPRQTGQGHELTLTTPRGPLVFEYFDGREEALRRWRDLSRLLDHQGWLPQADS